MNFPILLAHHTNSGLVEMPVLEPVLARFELPTPLIETLLFTIYYIVTPKEVRIIIKFISSFVFLYQKDILLRRVARSKRYIFAQRDDGTKLIINAIYFTVH